MARPDVTVMGGGIFGLTVAWACAGKGARVRLVEAQAIGCGSSGGILGALAPHVPDNWTPLKAFQRDALLAAEAFWREIEEIGGLSAGFARSGRVQPLRPEDVDRAKSRSEAARTLWSGRAELRLHRADGLAPFGLRSPSGLVLHDTLSARLHPRRACAALAAALRARGVEIVIGAGEPPEPTGAIVWATGHEGLIRLNREFGIEIGRPVKGQALLLRHGGEAGPQVFAGGLHIVPHDDGTVAIGSTTEPEFHDDRPSDQMTENLHRRAVEWCPALQGADRLEAWAGLRPRTRRRAPLLGRWMGRPGHFLANGGFKIGFGLAPNVGRVMAALVLDGHDEIPDGCRLEDVLY